MLEVDSLTMECGDKLPLCVFETYWNEQLQNALANPGK